jgi:hypothetical protein
MAQLQIRQQVFTLINNKLSRNIKKLEDEILRYIKERTAKGISASRNRPFRPYTPEYKQYKRRKLRSWNGKVNLKLTGRMLNSLRCKVEIIDSGKFSVTISGVDYTQYVELDRPFTLLGKKDMAIILSEIGL